MGMGHIRAWPEVVSGLPSCTVSQFPRRESEVVLFCVEERQDSRHPSAVHGMQIAAPARGGARRRERHWNDCTDSQGKPCQGSAHYAALSHAAEPASPQISPPTLPQGLALPG